MNFTAKDFFDYFKHEDEKIPNMAQEQHDRWVQYKKDLQDGTKVIAKKDIASANRLVVRANKNYDKLLEMNRNFQERKSKQEKIIKEQQKDLRETILAAEKRIGTNSYSRYPLFRALMGLEVELTEK